jgi:predicted PurR-regulated permease PerM
MSEDILQDRRQRTKTYKRAVIFGGLLISGYLLWSLQPLILPVIFGLLLAYICLPLIERMQRRGIPKSISVILLLMVSFLFLFYSFVFIKNQLPDTDEQMRLRVVALYKINDRYQDFMGIKPGNNEPALIYRLIGFETDPIMDSINEFLILKKNEIERFSDVFPKPETGDSTYAKLWQMFDSNVMLNLYTGETLLVDSVSESERSAAVNIPGKKSNISLIMNFFSTWMIMPIVFFFFLLDDGQLKRNILKLVPNMYFEMALTSIRNVDKAIGMYLRGTILETIAVFVSFMILLPLIGFNLTAAILIGLTAAILNIIPIIGSFAGIVLCTIYPLLIEDVNSILPFINDRNLILFAALTGVFVQVLDNTIFKPYILGNAIDLHPLLVVVSVIGGAIMFGFWGILFAIPVIVIIKVTVLNIMKQLKQYHIIES